MLGDGYHDVPKGKVAMVVTHLEMRTPNFRQVPLPDGLTFTRIKPDIDTYRDIFRRIGAPWLWYGRLVMEDAALEQIINDPEVQIYTLLKNEEPEALLELDFRVKDECELAYFGLSPALIGRGAGAYLMDQAVNCAFDIQIDRLHVHTCTIDSPQALNFYVRSGFAPYRQQIEIDDDPRVTGILPETAGPHVPILRP